jgi:ABC-2 type transport system permease protein
VSVFVHQLRTEQLVFWRSREAAVFIFIFPIMLFVLLASVFGDGDYEGRPVTDYLLTGLLGYGVANTAFAGLAIILVARREMGILKRIRSTPLPPPTYLAAVLASIMLVFLLQTTCLFVVGRLLFDAHVPSELFSLALAVSFGAVCFAGMGVGAASLIRSAEGSSAVVNVIVLPMAFLSGSFGPTADYPDFLEKIGEVLPLRYFIELVGAIYLDREQFWSQGSAIGVVAAWGAIGLAIAVRGFRWEPREG